MNGLARTGGGAFAAFNTFFVVNHGQIILHRDRAGRANLRAFAAGDATDLAFI